VGNIKVPYPKANLEKGKIRTGPRNALPAEKSDSCLAPTEVHSREAPLPGGGIVIRFTCGKKAGPWEGGRYWVVRGSVRSRLELKKKDERGGGAKPANWKCVPAKGEDVSQKKTSPSE